MAYSSVKKIPFKGYARAYETTVKKLATDPDTGKEVVKEEKITVDQLKELIDLVEKGEQK